MRCFQYIGLNQKAKDWLEENCVKEPIEFCPHCGKPTKETLKVIWAYHHDSFMGEGPLLETYEAKDGALVNVVIQEESWASGPVCFLCLEIERPDRPGIANMKFCEWTDEEIRIML